VLIARAPVRVSFFGGGTDLPAYYLRHGGAVLSATIDKYVYVILNVSEQHSLQITSSDYHTFYRHARGEPLLWDGDLSLPKAVLHHFGVEHGLAVFLASEVPPGTGLGSSSSATVALVKTVSTACGFRLPPQQVAELACEIEIRKLKKPIGVQDQYAAAFGGLNWMTFGATGVTVEALAVPDETLDRLAGRLVLAHTGSVHDSAAILGRQTRSSSAGDPVVIEALQGVHGLALQARELLQAGELDRFGALLDEAWRHKRKFAAGVTNPRIEECYALARRNGALGGKIAGAGGGGFLMLYCEEGTVDRVQSALAGKGLRCLDYGFEADGARVLFNAGLCLEGAAPRPGREHRRLKESSS
jgi:D-glycero-alpha-D-manno-heptose-7-phosphate kinase